MREDLDWFRDDNFAGHLFKEIQEAGKQLQDEMKENARNSLGGMTEIVV